MGLRCEQVTSFKQNKRQQQNRCFRKKNRKKNMFLKQNNLWRARKNIYSSVGIKELEESIYFILHS